MGIKNIKFVFQITMRFYDNADNDDYLLSFHGLLCFKPLGWIIHQDSRQSPTRHSFTANYLYPHSSWISFSKDNKKAISTSPSSAISAILLDTPTNRIWHFAKLLLLELRNKFYFSYKCKYFQ